MKRINRQEAYSLAGACTNASAGRNRPPPSYRASYRGPYLLRYAQEASWREDHRRISNGEQASLICRAGDEARAVRRFFRLLATAPSSLYLAPAATHADR